MFPNDSLNICQSIRYLLNKQLYKRTLYNLAKFTSASMKRFEVSFARYKLNKQVYFETVFMSRHLLKLNVLSHSFALNIHFEDLQAHTNHIETDRNTYIRLIYIRFYTQCEVPYRLEL